MTGRENKQILVKYGGTQLRVHACQLQHVKDAKTLREYEVEDENDQTDIITTKISKNKTFKMNDESSLSTPSFDTIVSEENS